MVLRNQVSLDNFGQAPLQQILLLYSSMFGMIRSLHGGGVVISIVRHVYFTRACWGSRNRSSHARTRVYYLGLGLRGQSTWEVTRRP